MKNVRESTVVETTLVNMGSLKTAEKGGVTLNTRTMKVLEEIHKSLFHDPGFFIFFEGVDTQLRCSYGNIRRVTAWAGRYKIVTTDWKVWEEPWVHTKKFQLWYQGLFHLYTQAMFMFNEQECQQALEWVTHCFLNTQKRNLYPEGRVVKGGLNNARIEGMALASVLVNRAINNR